MEPANPDPNLPAAGRVVLAIIDDARIATQFSAPELVARARDWIEILQWEASLREFKVLFPHGLPLNPQAA